MAVAAVAGGVAVATHVGPQRLRATTGARDVAQRVSDPAAEAARLPVGPQAPAVHADGWLNSAPLGPGDLAGKVVLYDFWTFGCINCQHTLPHLLAWHARYARDGLVIVGIHTPEFAYESDPANVAAYLAREGIHYPVALDLHSRVWDAFGNQYWPAFYLHDREGRRRLVHIGEGGYTQIEDAIRALLGVDPASPRAGV